MPVDVMGTTILPWCVIVEQKIVELIRFRQFLRPEERVVFDDLLTQCKLFAAGGEVFTSPVKEVSLLFWMVFAQHKKLTELEKRLNENPRLASRQSGPCGRRNREDDQQHDGDG